MSQVEKVICARCGKYHEPHKWNVRCLHCGCESSFHDKWWYGRPIPSGEIHGKVLEDGRRVIPKFFVEVHANLNRLFNDKSIEIPDVAWIQAEQWFRKYGWKWIDDEEWYSYSISVIKYGILVHKKYKKYEK